MAKDRYSPLAEVQARNLARAERSAAKANATDPRFAEILKGFPDTPDPESLAEIKAKGDAAKLAQDARITEHRKQLEGGR